MGEGELSLVHLPEYIIPFLLKNAPLKVGYRTCQGCRIIMMDTVLRIRDVYPGSEFFPSRIPDPHQRIFLPKNWFLSSRKYGPGCSSRIRILIFTHPVSGSRSQKSTSSEIPDPVAQHWMDRSVTTGFCFSNFLKVHKIENFFDSDFGICVISLLVISKH